MTADLKALLRAYDAAVAEELPRISQLAYNSKSICNYFSDKVRARITAALEDKGDVSNKKFVEHCPDGQKCGCITTGCWDECARFKKPFVGGIATVEVALIWPPTPPSEGEK